MAQEKANQEKIGATVQAARASADNMADDVGYLKPYRLTIARQTKLIDALQAQRDELLDACKLVDRAYAGDGVSMSVAVDACLLAIARATKGGTGQ